MVKGTDAWGGTQVSHRGQGTQDTGERPQRTGKHGETEARGRQARLRGKVNAWDTRSLCSSPPAGEWGLPGTRERDMDERRWAVKALRQETAQQDEA